MGQLPTKRQKELLTYINQYIKRRGFSPTYQEMAQFLDVSSVATVFDHLAQLSQKNFIKIYKGAVRGVEILGQKPRPLKLELPLLGYIAAGQPIEAIAQEETVAVSPNLVSNKKSAFVLKVKGDSMIEEGILDGDYVVVEEQKTANDGDIVVALLEGGLATLKKFYQEKDRIRLESANVKMPPIFSKNVEIQGKVKGIIRRF